MFSYERWWYLFPAFALIESEISMGMPSPEAQKAIEDFLSLLPEEIDGENYIDKETEQMWYTKIKHPHEDIYFLAKNIYEMGHTFNGWNLDYSQSLYDAYYTKMKYLDFKTKYIFRQKHYLEKAERFLNGEKDLSTNSQLKRKKFNRVK